MAAFVNGGFGKTASIIMAPTHTSAVGAGAFGAAAEVATGAGLCAPGAGAADCS